MPKHADVALKAAQRTKTRLWGDRDAAAPVAAAADGAAPAREGLAERRLPRRARARSRRACIQGTQCLRLTLMT